MNNKEKYEENKMKVMDDVDYFKAQLDILFDEIEQVKATVNKIAGIGKIEDEPEKEELTADNIPDFIDHLSNDVLPKKDECKEEVDEELESVKESIRETEYPAVDANNVGEDFLSIFSKFDKILDDIEVRTEDDSSYNDIDDSVTAKSILSKEFVNWGFDPDTNTNCKSILYVIDCFEDCNVSKDDSIDMVDEKVNLSYSGWLNDALNYIRKNAKFENTEYLDILGRMNREAITNKIILRQILELCED